MVDLWLTLALSGSLWLSLAHSGSLSGSLWLSLALSGSLWLALLLSLAPSCSLLLSQAPYLLTKSSLGSQGPCSARSVAATLYPALDDGDGDGVGDDDGDSDLVIFVGGSGSTFCFPAAGQRGERSELHPHLDHQDKSGLKMSSPS